MAAAITVGAFMPWLGRMFVPVAVLAVAGTYLAVAIATRELTRRDLATLRKVIGR
jgi:hypothetical protein